MGGISLEFWIILRTDPLDPFNDLCPFQNMVITESLSLSSLHPAEPESYRQKAIVDCIAEDEEVEYDWEKQIQEGNLVEVFNKM